MSRIILFLLLFFLSKEIKIDPLAQFIVWNVGQGSWSTFIKNQTCYHFDMGGERSQIKELKKYCHEKRNEIYITHLDSDHINKVQTFVEHFKKTCLYYPKKLNPFAGHISSCFAPPSFIKVVSLGSEKSKNASSIVYWVDRKILITGDATASEEKKWAHLIKSRVVILVAGHHGSNTSTSDILLNATRPLWVIFSARKKKYGHPHILVTKRLIKQKIPYLSTEDFGNIYFHF